MCCVARWPRRSCCGVFPIVRSAGYDLNWSEVDGDLLMIATIQAAQGVADLLRQVLGEAIEIE